MKTGGFEAAYNARNLQTGNEMRFLVRYEPSGLVRVDVPAQNFSTYWNGKEVVHWDRAAGQVLLMDLTGARAVLKKAAAPLDGLAWLAPELKGFSARADAHGFYYLDLTDTGVTMAVTFGARPAEAPWLARLAAEETMPPKEDDAYVDRRGDVTYRVAADTGLIAAVEYAESGETRRTITLASLEKKKIDRSVFTENPPSSLPRERIDADAATFDALFRSSFNEASRHLITAHAAKTASITDEQKRKIEAAVKSFWTEAFRGNTELGKRFVEMVESPESIALIRGQYENQAAYASFKEDNKLSDEDAQREWPNFVAAEIAQQIVSQALAPVQNNVIAAVIARARRAAAANALTPPQTHELIHVYTDPIVEAAFETLGEPARARIAKVLTTFE
ncbi:MAG: hypothetical protein M5R36_01720 [Deltaproteobacteria bacterium]|nr:hypothetical protein [Deltaproteobacteria bacterium]